MFITATDTGVGKTIITLAIARSLIDQGVKVGVMKPVSCGPAFERDEVLYEKLLNLDDPIELINPVHFEEPVAPYAVSKKQLAESSKRIIRQKILNSYKKLKAKYDIVLVEGIGGVMVPITKDYFVADMIKDFGLETIVVARAGLGTINHTLLTLNELKRRKIKVAGVVLNGFKACPEHSRGGDDLSERTNAEIIEELGGVRILAKIKHLDR